MPGDLLTFFVVQFKEFIYFSISIGSDGIGEFFSRLGDGLVTFWRLRHD